MKIRFIKSLAVVIAMVAGSAAFGQDYYEGCDSEVETVSFLGGDSCQKDCYDDCGKGGKGCDDGCGKGGCGILDGLGCGINGGGGAVYGLIEWTYFAYHRADGSRVGDFPGLGDDVQADFHSSLRYTAGYIAPGGLGVRARYWRFGHSSLSEGAGNGFADPREGLYTDTYNLDVELFETIALSCNWDIEISGGIRYNDFEELMLDDQFIGPGGPFAARLNASDSFGGVGGLEARRCLPIGSFYLGFRTSILMANDAVRGQFGFGTNNNGVALQDVPRQQFEIFGGWQYERCLSNGGIVFLRAGAEWQHWMNFSSAFDGDGDQIGSEDEWDGQSNVGFGGFVLGAGILY